MEKYPGTPPPFPFLRFYQVEPTLSAFCDPPLPPPLPVLPDDWFERAQARALHNEEIFDYNLRVKTLSTKFGIPPKFHTHIYCTGINYTSVLPKDHLPLLNHSTDPSIPEFTYLNELELTDEYDLPEEGDEDEEGNTITDKDILAAAKLKLTRLFETDEPGRTAKRPNTSDPIETD